MVILAEQSSRCVHTSRTVLAPRGVAARSTFRRAAGCLSSRRSPRAVRSVPGIAAAMPAGSISSIAATALAAWLHGVLSTADFWKICCCSGLRASSYSGR